MKRSTKIILITTALLTATGAAVAARSGGCNQGGGMYGQGPGQGYAQGMQMQGRKGMRQGGPGAIFQLDNLTDTQKQQITELRKAQHEKMFNLREQKFQQRAEMQKKVEAILTEEQKNQLAELRSNRRW